MFTLLSVVFNNAEIIFLGFGYIFSEEMVKLAFVILSGQYLVYLFACRFYSGREFFLLITVFFLSIISGFKAGYLDFITVIFQLFLLVGYVCKFSLLSYSARLRVVLLTSFWSQFIIFIINIIDFVFRGAVMDIAYQNVFPLYFALMLFSNEMVLLEIKKMGESSRIYALGMRLDYLNIGMTLLMMVTYFGFYFIFPDFRVEMKIFGLIFLIILLRCYLRIGPKIILLLGILLIAVFFGFCLSVVDQDLSIYSGLIGFERDNSLLLRIAVLNEQLLLFRQEDGWLGYIFGLGPGFSAWRYDFYHPIFKESLINLPSHAGLLSIVSDIGVFGLFTLIYILFPFASVRDWGRGRNSSILFLIFVVMNIISIQWIPSAIYYHFGGSILLTQLLNLSRSDA